MNYFKKLGNVLENTPDLSEILLLLKELQRYGKNSVFVIGNGGSSATATHFAQDLSKSIDPPIRAMSFDNLALMTAYANDNGYDQVFVKQVVAWSRPGDVLFCISTSGQSENVISALLASNKMISVALTGENGGLLSELANYVIKVPHPQIEIVEDAHSAICHSLISSMKYD